jgi:hypothetical protein
VVQAHANGGKAVPGHHVVRDQQPQPDGVGRGRVPDHHRVADRLDELAVVRGHELRDGPAKSRAKSAASSSPCASVSAV